LSLSLSSFPPHAPQLVVQHLIHTFLLPTIWEFIHFITLPYSGFLIVRSVPNAVGEVRGELIRSGDSSTAATEKTVEKPVSGLTKNK
jgi:hypothetical protein